MHIWFHYSLFTSSPSLSVPYTYQAIGRLLQLDFHTDRLGPRQGIITEGTQADTPSRILSTTPR
jgi:hypothetical protein